MEMMDLPGYLDSFRQGYDRALQDLYQRVQTMSDAMAAASPAYAPAQPWTGPAVPQQGRRGRHVGHGHHHEHHRRHDHDCGCEHEDCDDDECCECCIGDADIVVYGRCGELRVVPIEIENETRKVRENVTLEVSEIRSRGGRTLPWRALLRPAGPLTIEPCSTATLELVVQIACQEPVPTQPSPPSHTAPTRVATERSFESPGVLSMVAETRATLADVDECEVGYITIRVGGCLIRPIVVAIAALPRGCGSYHAGCSCSCCC